MLAAEQADIPLFLAQAVNLPWFFSFISGNFGIILT
jgi:hypothetical protein